MAWTERHLVVSTLVALAVAAASCTSGVVEETATTAEPLIAATGGSSSTALPNETTASQGTDRNRVSSGSAEPPATPRPSSPPPLPGSASGFAGAGLVTAAVGGADVSEAPGEEPYARVREGVVLAGLGEVAHHAGWLSVMTPCDVVGYVPSAEVFGEPAAPVVALGPEFDFGSAVLVLDPGHGGPNQGAPSPDGTLIEKDLNLDIARRVRDLLLEAHDVNWDSGAIDFGDAVPAAARVILTRSGDASDADYEAGLLFRATVANAVGAHAMVSIHNNAGFNADVDRPGSDAYYQSQLADSRRLAALLVAEFHRGFAGFEANWVATLPVGAKSRLSPQDGATQYYGLLRLAEVPTAIAEGAYIANQSEANLLATPGFRQAYAEAVYRALVRFTTTEDAGGPSFDPVVWEGNAGSGGAKPGCQLPIQDPP